MLDSLRRPFPARALALSIGVAAGAIALYCITYTALSGRTETLAESLGWAVANVCPWLVAIEAGKRARHRAAVAAVLALAFISSVALGFSLGVSTHPLAFETLRRIPGLLAAAGAIALLRSSIGRSNRNDAEVPLLPKQIDWVRAAGNYVELRAADRTIVYRTSLSALEQRLAAHGFVRIHRSVLVRRDLIARVRPEDVVLADGTHLKIGKRYRAALAA